MPIPNESHHQFAERVKAILYARPNETFTFYDDDKRKWVITQTINDVGIKSASVETTHPDTNDSAIGTRKGWLVWNTEAEEWEGGIYWDEWQSVHEGPISSKRILAH